MPHGHARLLQVDRDAARRGRRGEPPQLLEAVGRVGVHVALEQPRHEVLLARRQRRGGLVEAPRVLGGQAHEQGRLS